MSSETQSIFVLSSTSWLHAQIGFLGNKIAARAKGLPHSDPWLKVAFWGSPGSPEASSKLCFVSFSMLARSQSHWQGNRIALRQIDPSFKLKGFSREIPFLTLRLKHFITPISQRRQESPEASVPILRFRIFHLSYIYLAISNLFLLKKCTFQKWYGLETVHDGVHVFTYTTSEWLQERVSQQEFVFTVIQGFSNMRSLAYP